jgi:hypothetical protein
VLSAEQEAAEAKIGQQAETINKLETTVATLTDEKATLS